jgi:hypothetical protein
MCTGREAVRAASLLWRSEALCATYVPTDKLMDLASVKFQMYGRTVSIILTATPRGAFRSKLQQFYTRCITCTNVWIQITAVLYPVYNMYECFSLNYSSFIPGVKHVRMFQSKLQQFYTRCTTCTNVLIQITAVLYPLYNMYECFNLNYSSSIPGV